jgi:hypothetical protein
LSKVSVNAVPDGVQADPVKGERQIMSTTKRLLDHLHKQVITPLEGGQVTMLYVTGRVMVEKYAPLCEIDSPSGGLVVTAPCRSLVTVVLTQRGDIVNKNTPLFWVAPRPEPPSTIITIPKRRGFKPPDENPPPAPMQPSPKDPIPVDVVYTLVPFEMDQAPDPFEPDVKLPLLGDTLPAYVPPNPKKWDGKLTGTRTYSILRRQEQGLKDIVKQMGQGGVVTNESELLQVAQQLFFAIEGGLQLALLYEFRELIESLKTQPKPVTKGRLTKGNSNAKLPTRSDTTDKDRHKKHRTNPYL